MQVVDGWPAPSPVRVPGLSVTVNGSVREVESASVSASVRGTDVSARTGSVTWAPVESVRRRQLTPVDATAPKRGDRVEVSAGEKDVLARVLTGKVESTQAQVPGDLVSEVMDDWDLLGQSVSVTALAPVMFPRESGGALRSIGLTATAITQRVLGLCGFYATPPAVIGTMVSASLNGTIWPENGVLQDNQTLPTFTPAPWGEAARGFSASYAPGTRSFSDGSLEIAFMIDSQSAAGFSQVAATWSPGYIRLTIGPSTAAAQFYDGVNAPVNILTLSTADLAGVTLIRLRVGSGGTWRLNTDTGIEKFGDQTIPAGFLGSPSSWTVHVPTDGRIIGGVNAGFPNAEGPTTFTPTAVIDPADGTLAASRAIIDRPAMDVLKERADAEFARMWIDSRGVFHWRSRTVWGTGAPVAVIGDADLLGYGVGMDYDSMYAGATVSCVVPRTEMRRQPTVSLYQGSRQALSAGDVERRFIEAPADEDWYNLDQFVGVLGGAAQTGNFNKGVRSFDSAVRVGTDGSTEVFAYGTPGDYASFAFEQVNIRKCIHTITVGANLPADQTIETRAPDLSKLTGTGIWSQWNTYATPVIRGHGRAVWIEEKRYGTATTEERLPRLEHDCSWWLQGGAPQRLANWLATAFTAPRVTMTGIGIVPDARLELGDVVELTDSTYADLKITAVITGIDYSTRNGEASMSIDVEVLTAVSTRRTYEQVQAEASWRTYAQYAALIGAVTYSEQEAG